MLLLLTKLNRRYHFITVLILHCKDKTKQTRLIALKASLTLVKPAPEMYFIFSSWHHCRCFCHSSPSVIFLRLLRYIASLIFMRKSSISVSTCCFHVTRAYFCLVPSASKVTCFFTQASFFLKTFHTIAVFFGPLLLFLLTSQKWCHR